MSTGKPMFSIVCTTFNRSKLLLRAVNSVLRQRFKDFELIIVNDGSTDDTSSLVKTFYDSRIIYLEHVKNRGLNAARNTGILKAKGKFLAFLDDDDELAESALEIAIETYRDLINDRVKILIFNCVDYETGLFSGANLGKKMIITFKDFLCQKLRGDYWIVVDRDFLIRNGLFDEKAVGGAGLLLTRLLRICDAYYVPKILYYAYRMHGMDRNTHLKFRFKNSKKYVYFFTEFLKEFGEEMKQICPKSFSKYTSDLAFHQMINGDFQSARTNLFLSMRVCFSLNVIGLFLLSFLQNKYVILSVFTFRQNLISLLGKC